MSATLVHPGGTEVARDLKLGSHRWDVYDEWTSTSPRKALVGYRLVTPRTSITSLGYAVIVADTAHLGYLPAD